MATDREEHFPEKEVKTECIWNGVCLPVMSRVTHDLLQDMVMSVDGALQLALGPFVLFV